jgi:hypothetical protein
LLDFHEHEPQEVEGSSSSPSTLELGKKWLEDCFRNHPSCNRPIASPFTQEGWHPTRLLSITAKDSPLSIRLCVGSEVPINANYMTLSHCWGSLSILTLTGNNIEALQKNIRPEQLCKTFRDAVDITRKLGIGYLWIDSLCILQDSIEDWNHESTLMAQVYGNSFCNIAATKAPDGSHGCYADRDPKTIIPCKISPTWDHCLKSEEELWKNQSLANYSLIEVSEDSVCIVSQDAGREAPPEFFYVKDEVYNSFEKEPLNRRAWVFRRSCWHRGFSISADR